MPKPTLEFLPLSSFPPSPLTSLPEGTTTRILSHDLTTGDLTQVLYHPPGSEWGGEVGKAKGKNGDDWGTKHEYWEEVLILKGRFWDKTLEQWFSAPSYCCRPPGMPHGPWKADPEQGCEEFVIVRYEREEDRRARENKNDR